MCVASGACLVPLTFSRDSKALRLNRFNWRRWRRLEQNELGRLRRHLHARLARRNGVKVQSLFVSQIFLEILRSFSNFLRYFSNFLRYFSNFLRYFSNFLRFLRFLTLSLISGAGGSHIPFNSGRFTLKNNFPKRR
jgi:hypothetical protein